MLPRCKGGPCIADENSQRYARSAAERDPSNINLDRPVSCELLRARYAFN